MKYNHEWTPKGSKYTLWNVNKQNMVGWTRLWLWGKSSKACLSLPCDPGNRACAFSGLLPLFPSHIQRFQVYALIHVDAHYKLILPTVIGKTSLGCEQKDSKQTNNRKKKQRKNDFSTVNTDHVHYTMLRDNESNQPVHGENTVKIVFHKIISEFFFPTYIL